MNCLFKDSEIDDFLKDASNFRGNCQGVFFPEKHEDVARIITEANESKSKITAAGNGTGLTGGRVPLSGNVISLSKLNSSLEIDKVNMTVTASAGIILRDLQEFCENNGFFFAPDPTETLCQAGAVVATNASGAKSYKYGATRNSVLELDVVLPCGDSLTIKRGEIFANGNTMKFNSASGKNFIFPIPDIQMPNVKNSAGYYSKPGMDLIDLFIGQEGTLGIITKCKFSIHPLPESLFSCLAFFDDAADSLNFIKYFKSDENTSLSPRALEFFDGNALRFLSGDYPVCAGDYASAVWFDEESTNADFDTLTDKYISVLNSFNCNENNILPAFDSKTHLLIKEFRHAISYKINEYVASKGLRKLGTDTAVPIEYFTSFYFSCQNIAEKSGLNYVSYGHFGDSHLHLNFIPENDSQFELGKSLYKEICKLAVQMKGTVSAEHGIGKTKTDYLEMMYGKQGMKEFARLKKVLDPNLILNFGNIVPEKYFTI